MNIPRQNLRTPGPTPVPEDIVEAMGTPMINHRGPEFHELISRVTSQLKQVFMTQNDLFILTASGTGSLEAAIVNTLSPGDRVIAATAGSFGDRFVDLARAYGVDLTVLEFEWGAAVDPDAIRQALLKDPAVKAVMVTHNETSTGITHPLQEMAQVVKGEFHKLLLVDAVSSLGCIPLPVDGWDCDVVGTASQKGFMIPPGLSFVSMSAAAWEGPTEPRPCPGSTLTLAPLASTWSGDKRPSPPAVGAMYGLSKALDNILEGGFGKRV